MNFPQITARIFSTSLHLAVLAGATASCLADVQLPSILGSNMVIQQGQPAPIWGKAWPEEHITVTFAGQTKNAIADASGKWEVRLDPLSANKEGRPLSVEGKNKIALENVLVGEVWICAGQSNMQVALKASEGGPPAAQAATQPLLRLFSVDRKSALQPQEDCVGKWEQCTPESAPLFSAVGYYFGNELQKTLDVPVGLIHASWGGQSIETFIPHSAMAEQPWGKGIAARLDQAIKNFDPKVSENLYKEALAKWEAANSAYEQAKKDGTAKGRPPKKPELPGHKTGPCLIYNGMIAPLRPFGIRGAIWYQGETNRTDGMLYHEKMKTLIGSWRQIWNQGEFPFLFVQLAPCKYSGDRPSGREPVGPPGADARPSQTLPWVWQAQLESLKIPNTGMAVTVDLDGPALHPKRKKEVGQRLAQWALANTYGRKGFEYSGPLFKSLKVEGDKLRVQFEHVGKGLATRDGKAPDWFEVAGNDKVFYPANAKIDGPDLLASSDQVKSPKFVRYGWDEIAQPNLMNKDGLPASPFISDPDSLAAPAPGAPKK